MSSILHGFLQPAQTQSAEETIPTLCDRVANSTLITDRRSAVLGLKSFSRQCRELVVASGLKPLLNTLRRDCEDYDTTKAVLETLLILFIRGDGDEDLTRTWISQQSRLQNGKYPSPLVMKQELDSVDQFSLCIVDALIQDPEYVQLLIQFLETDNFHIKLYSIQLLEAILATRPARARSAIVEIPTSISVIIHLLEDIHEPIRDEAILLLMTVVNDSPHVQRLVAFENIFEKLFHIIEEEGSLRGSIVVNDCISLINNILKYNTSNQTLFIETGNLPKLASLLNGPFASMEENETFYWNEQRINNIVACMDIVSLLVEPGVTTTESNQTQLLRSNILMIVLRLAFYPTISQRIRYVALLTAANVIRENPHCQEDFGKIDVPYFIPTGNALAASAHTADSYPPVSVVNLLLNWVLYANSVRTFDLRVAALGLLKAYFSDNPQLQLKFLERQRDDYYRENDIPLEAEDNDQVETESEAGSFEDSEEFKAIKSCNLFEVILGYDPELNLNPYKLYFTLDLLMFFFSQDDEAKSSVLMDKVRDMRTGPASEDETPISTVQTIAELLLASLTEEQIRIPLSYLTFLIFWFFIDGKAVNDFLSDRTTLNSLLSFCYQINDENITIKCLVTMLLGVAYEFSSKDSPFPRIEYHQFITKRLGRDNYASRITQFKEGVLFSKAVDEFDPTNPPLDDTGLPKLYFSTYFTHIFNDNFYRIRTALSHDPEEDPYGKLTFEEFEELHEKLSEMKISFAKMDAEKSELIDSLQGKFDKLSTEHATAVQELEKLSRDHSSLNDEYNKVYGDLTEVSNQLKEVCDEKVSLERVVKDQEKRTTQDSLKLGELQKNVEDLKTQLKHMTEKKEKAEDGINKMNRELFGLTRANQALEEKQKKLEKSKKQELDNLNKDNTNLKNVIANKESDIAQLGQKVREFQQKVSELTLQNKQKSDDLDEWKSKFENHENLVSTLTDKLKTLAGSFKELQDERANIERQLVESSTRHEGELADLNKQLANVTGEKEGLDQQREKLQAQVTDYESTVSKLKEEHADELTILVEENKEIEERLTEMEQECSKLKDLNEKKQLEITSLQKQIQSLNMSIGDLGAKSGEVEKELEKLRAECAEKDHKLVSLGDEQEKWEKERGDLQKKLEELGCSSEVLQHENEDLKNSLDKLETQGRDKEAELNSKIKTLEEEKQNFIEQMENKTSEMKRVMEELEASKRDVEAELESSSTKIKKLEADLDAANKDRESIVKDNDNNKNELKTAKQQLEELRSTITAKTESVDALTQKLKEVEVREQEVTEENEKLKTEISSLTGNSTEREKKLNEYEEQLKDLRQKNESNKVKMESSTKAFEREKKQLQEEADRLKEELKKRSQEFEKERKMLNEGSSSAIQEYSEKVSSLEGQLSDAKEELERTSNELETTKENLAEVSALNDDLKKKGIDDVKELESQLRQEKAKFQKLQNEFEGALKEKEDLASQWKEEKEKQQEELTRKDEELKENAEKCARALGDIKELKIEKEKELEKLRGEFDEKQKLLDEDVKSLKTEREKLTKEKTDLEEELGALRVELENEKKASADTEKLGSEKEKLAKELQEKEESLSGLEKLKSVLETQLKESEDAKSKLVEDAKTSGEQITSLEATIKELKASLEETEENLDASRREHQDYTKKLEEQIEQLRTDMKRYKEKAEDTSELEQLRKENAELKAEAQDKGELDDLMLLISELDEKNNKYRKKLEELGVEMSSEDEDGGDDDEEDEDEDEE